MRDPIDRSGWYYRYFIAALECRHYDTQQAEAWAFSMALIAEQFVDENGGIVVESDA